MIDLFDNPSNEGSLVDITDLGDVRYTAQVMPELYRNQPQPRLENWSEEDLEMYCGIYTDERRETVQAEQLLYDIFVAGRYDGVA